MKLDLKFSYADVPWDDVVAVYIQEREKECYEWSTISEGVAYEGIMKHPIPRSIAPLVPWLDALEIRLMVSINADDNILNCVMLTETSKTSMAIKNIDGVSVCTCSCIIDTATWNPLVVAATPKIATMKFKERRKHERKLARHKRSRATSMASGHMSSLSVSSG